MRYFIFTFGCQTNEADSERIETRLKALGHEKAADKNKADLIVINACSVRQSAIDRVYGKIENFAKSKRKIILTGCITEHDKKKLKNMVDEIWHPDEYFDLSPSHLSSFSASVPIMTGCDNFCTYCAVPFTRGREKSRPAREIVAETKNLIQKDYKEIWLLGQNVNSYHSGKINFPKLLKMINNIPGKFWLRFTSLHPKDFSDELIKVMAKEVKITKYINLPVQSGDNEILKKMNRNYTREDYIKLVNKIRLAMPNIALSTDTIVGFPGETKKQFLNTAKLYKKLKFDMAFISEYSTRPGTAAALTMKDNVPHAEKEKRKKILTDILRKTALENNKKLTGKTLDILIDSIKEAKPPAGGLASKYSGYARYFGRTEGNKVTEILTENSSPLSLKIGDFTKVKIVKAEPWKLIAGPVKPKIIAVIGPTASGKSDVAVEVAKKFNGEIISADSRQVYRGMDIGTGKVTKKETKGVKHYLLDVAHPNEIFSAGDFKILAEKAIAEILEKNKLPIVCGGTGFYIHALLNNIEIPKVPADWKLRKNLENKSAETLFKMLKNLDEERAKNIDPQNKRRLVRAIEIAKKLGKIPPLKSDFNDILKSDFNVLWLGIKRPDKELKKLIKTRLLKRLKQGMLTEVKKLIKNGVSFKRLYEFGLEYRFVSLYLQKKISEKEMIEQLNTAINQFAKRQMTWFKKYAPGTRWVKNKREALRLSEQFLKN